MLKKAKRSSNWKYQGRVEELKNTAPILASTSFHLHADAPARTYVPEADEELPAASEPASTEARAVAPAAGQPETAPFRQWPSHIATGTPPVRPFRANPRLFVPPIGIPANQSAQAGGTGAVVAAHLRPNLRSSAPVYTFGQHPGRRAPTPPPVSAAPEVRAGSVTGAARLAGGAASPASSQRLAAPKARPVRGSESGPRVYTYGTCESCQDD